MTKLSDDGSVSDMLSVFKFKFKLTLTEVVSISAYVCGYLIYSSHLFLNSRTGSAPKQVTESS